MVNVLKEGGRKNQRGDFIVIDTTNILFICGGAFSGLEKIINQYMDAASKGFGAKMKKVLSDQNVQGKHIDSAAPNDFVRYGLISESVGRITVIVMRSFSLTCSSGQTMSLRSTTNIFFND